MTAITRNREAKRYGIKIYQADGEKSTYDVWIDTKAGEVLINHYMPRGFRFNPKAKPITPNQHKHDSIVIPLSQFSYLLDLLNDVRSGTRSPIAALQFWKEGDIDEPGYEENRPHYRDDVMIVMHGKHARIVDPDDSPYVFMPKEPVPDPKPVVWDGKGEIRIHREVLYHYEVPLELGQTFPFMMWTLQLVEASIDDFDQYWRAKVYDPIDVPSDRADQETLDLARTQ